MLRVTYTVGSTTIDITKYVDFKTLVIHEEINIPSQLNFSAYNYDPGFPTPVQRAYVRVFSTRFNRSLFTGFVSSQPNVVYRSLIAPGVQLFRFEFTCTSDEHLLNVKAVPFIPAFIDQTQGEILSTLANILCPGMYDTSAVGSGDIEPYYQYDPNSSWSEVAKKFADGSRYRYKARDKRIWFQPYGDAPLGIEYDETKGQESFDPIGLSTQVLAVPTVNDVTIVGNTEAGNNREDYFIGDGFTGNFPLRHKVFNGASVLLLSDDWTESQFNTQQWFVSDPGGQFNLGAGALNIVSNFALPLGRSYIQMNNGLELAGGIDLEHGEFGFNDYSEGIIGGLYTESLDSNVPFSSGSCLGGFYISSPTGVVTSASGAAGVVIQPTWQGEAIGPPIITEVNHNYVLQTVVTAPKYVRYNRWYRSAGGNAYGGVETAVTGDITFIVQDFNIAAATGFYYLPNITKRSVHATDLPAFCAYALVNNQQLNVTVSFTTIAMMPLGALSAYEGPSGLWMPTGLILPMLPPGSGGYIGAVEPWPSDASGAIFKPPLQRSGTPTQEVLGNGFELQAAQITAGNEADTLAFYAQTLPAAGTPIRFQSYQSQAALSRLQASGSIAEEAYIVGDDGLRSAIVSNLNPLPRTSEDCDAAARAYLDDRTQVFYNGTYVCTSYFLNQFSSDDQFYPTCGRYLYVNAPARNIKKQYMLVTQLTITVEDAVGVAQQSLAGLNQVGEVLRFQISFGADLHLEKILYNFVDIQPPSVLTPNDTAQPLNPLYDFEIATAYLPDLSSMIVNPISDTQASVTVFDQLVAPIEIRSVDGNWGQGATSDFIASVSASGFTLTRQQFEQIWYMRFVDTSTGTFSRRSKVVRIYYPVTPLQPTLISAQSNFVQLDFNGDIRNVYGVEVRELLQAQHSYVDPITHRLVFVPAQWRILLQKPAVSYGDLNLDLTKTYNTYPFSTNRTLYCYFFNHQWSYSAPTVVNIPEPDATLQAGYRFAQSLNILCSFADRTDITKQIWQVANASGFASGDILIEQTRNFAGEATFNVPSSGDIWVRTLLFDYIGSGSWEPSGGLHVPVGDLIASDYLTGQGSVPPILAGLISGSLFSYVGLLRSGVPTLSISNDPFTMTTPNGGSYDYGGFTNYFQTVLDSPGGTGQLQWGQSYYFYMSIDSPSLYNPATSRTYFDGAYQHPNTNALATSVKDGRITLTPGGLLVAMPASPTGTSGGGGGGTGGGGSYCGVLSSLIKMADGSVKRLGDLHLGDMVDNGCGGSEEVVARALIPSQRIRCVRAGRFVTHVADGHTLRKDYGWSAIAEIERQRFNGEDWPRVDTEDGMVRIDGSVLEGYETVCHLQLSGPKHTYVLDGFRTHNTLVKTNPV